MTADVDRHVRTGGTTGCILRLDAGEYTARKYWGLEIASHTDATGTRHRIELSLPGGKVHTLRPISSEDTTLDYGAGARRGAHCPGRAVGRSDLTDSDDLELHRTGYPIIADFDNDGEPEIGIAGKLEYVVYEIDGTARWQATVSDASNMTGSSVFDFEGDGKADVVYAGEDRLHIYDGDNGTERLNASGSFDPADHASGTAHEFPILLDIDDDGSTEILLASNPDAWMPSRPIWNQHAYHITNVEDAGTIPAIQDDNWASRNTFRTQDQSEVPGIWLADLYPLALALCMDCDTGEIVFYVPVVNDGIADAGPFNVDIYSGSVLIGTAATLGLNSGNSLLVGPFYTTAASWAGDFTVVIDGGEAVEECDEDNNTLTLDELPC